MADQTIDARDDLCPIPILRLGDALRAAGKGDTVELVTAGWRAEADVLAWAEDMGLDLETVRNDDGSTHFVIVKG